MNWLEGLLVVIVSWAVICLVLWRIYVTTEWEWPIGIAIPGTILLAVITPLMLGVYSNTTTFIKAQPQIEGTLISLQNTQSIDANISGGGSFLGHSFSGNMSGSTSCSFVMRYPDKTIRIITEDCKQIQFIEGDTFDVKKYVDVYYYPHSLKGDSKLYWGDGYVWVITIPTTSINSYIKFN